MRRNDRLKAMTHKALLMGAVLLSMALAACSLGDFNDGKAAIILQRAPVHIDAEQVVLSLGEVNCGVQNDLWDPPVQLGIAGEYDKDRSVARLTSAGKALHFDDDVSVHEPGFRFPYVQIRGDFNLGQPDIQTIRDGPDQNTKLVETKVGVKIDHPCFPNPLPIMGLRKGQFNQEFNPVIQFRLDDGWQIDKFVH